MKSSLKKWSEKHLTGLFVFNVALVLMVLLSTAQYFNPFFYLGINTIFFISLIISIFLLGARVKTMMAIAVIFLALTAFLKVVRVDVWADRASIYFYQSLFLGILLLFLSKK